MSKHDAEIAQIARDEILPLLTALLRRPSITPDDAGCQELIIERLTAAGFVCEQLPFGRVTNLWARLGSASPLLCFAGHTDVVPTGAVGTWTSDPFEPRLDGDRLYARGAADMKGGLAAMLVAAEHFLQCAGDFNGSIAFLITSDEEGIARDGTKRVMQCLSQRGVQIDWCVIGEPSSHRKLGDTIRIGRRGSLYGRLTIRGVQGHVAYPQLANNPIARFAPALKILGETVWDEGNEFFPPSSFQMVSIESDGGAANVTPAMLHAGFNIRYCDEWQFADLQQAVATILDEQKLDYEIEWELSGEPFLTSPGILTDTVRDAVVAECGYRPEMSTGGGTSDGRFIAPYGSQVVELGPVNATIHQVDEFVSVADVSRLAMIYQRVMHALLT